MQSFANELNINELTKELEFNTAASLTRLAEHGYYVASPPQELEQR
jgi:hypothetical protein